MEPRLKRNIIILAAKIISFFISDVVPCNPETSQKSTRKASEYTTSIRVNLSDAKTNGSGSILAPSLSSTHRHQSVTKANSAFHPFGVDK